MRIILTGGCTGGHIYPALAIGDKFREKDPDCEIIYLGHEWGLEKDIVPKYGYTLKYVDGKWVDRSNIFKLVDTAWHTEIGKQQSYKIMKKFKPDIVIATGGFVAVPVVLAAKKYGAKVYLHEQNAYPGMANKYMAKYAEKIYIGFKAAGEHFTQKDKLVYSGNPVRKEFYESNTDTARERMGIAENDFVITAFGGSLGADKINEMVYRIIEKYGNQKEIRIIFGTGKDYFEETLKSLKALGLAECDNVEIMPYIHNMADTLAASSVIICRSGALSTAEITVAGRAAIFVPSPNVTGDHQYYNARAVADNNGAVIVREEPGAAEKILGALEEFIRDPEIIKDMEKGSLKTAPPMATDIIYNGIVDSEE